MKQVTFSDIAIVACGTLKMELDQLKKEGFLDTDSLFFTPPGLHQNIQELEKELVKQIGRAKQKADKVIVVYGGKYCYVHADNPFRTMQTLIEEQGPGVVRVNATHCMDVMADEKERTVIQQKVAGGENVFWMTPGWVKYRKMVFKGWDKGIANENFPRHRGGAVILDAIGFLDGYMAKNPEDFLDYCDWMGIPMNAYPVSLDRLKVLLQEQAEIF